MHVRVHDVHVFIMTSFPTLMWLVRIISEAILKLNVACLTAIPTINSIF